MADQLSNLTYKPWMKGNFSDLQINGSNVAIVGNRQGYIQTRPNEREILAPVPDGINPQFTTIFNDGISLTFDLSSLIVEKAGVYYFSYTLIFDISNRPTSFVDLKISIVRKRDEEKISTGGVFNYNYAQKLNLTGIMDAEAGDLFGIKIETTGSVDLDGMYIYGSDSVNPSQLSAILIN